jgi:hypothetical protein
MKVCLFDHKDELTYTLLLLLLLILLKQHRLF